MGIFLNTNVSSLNAQRHLFNVTMNLNKSLERLSSGYKINRASDGAASLLASENLRSQIRGSNVAISNVQQGINMLQTADGALQQSYEVLQRIRELAVAGQNTGADYTALDAEYQELLGELDSISNNTSYNGQNILDGSIAAFNITIDADGGTVDIESAFNDVDAAALAVGQVAGTSDAMDDAAAATAILAEVDTAMGTVATQLADIGGHANTLNRQLNTLSIAVENYTAAEASIRNTDIAAETASLTRLQILQQAAAASLAQANQLPAIALQLLG